MNGIRAATGELPGLLRPPGDRARREPSKNQEAGSLQTPNLLVL